MSSYSKSIATRALNMNEYNSYLQGPSTELHQLIALAAGDDIIADHVNRPDHPHI